MSSLSPSTASLESGASLFLLPLEPHLALPEAQLEVLQEVLLLEVPPEVLQVVLRAVLQGVLPVATLLLPGSS